MKLYNIKKNVKHIEETINTAITKASTPIKHQLNNNNKAPHNIKNNQAVHHKSSITVTNY